MSHTDGILADMVLMGSWAMPSPCHSRDQSSGQPPQPAALLVHQAGPQSPCQWPAQSSVSAELPPAL